jgi:hypothetical protein
MYSGTSSVPRIYSGSMSRLRKQRRVNHEIANKSKKRIERKLTLEWYASLVEYCSPWWVAFPCLPWPRGFLLCSKGEDVRWWSSMRVDLHGIPGGYFIDWESALGMMTSWRTLLEYQTAGFSSRMRRVFIEQCLWFPNWGFSADFCAKGQLFSRIRLK